MHLKKLCALGLCALMIAGGAVGCQKKEPTVEVTGSNTDLAPVDALTPDPTLSGVYSENIPDYSTGNAKIDQDFQEQLKKLSASLKEGFQSESGDYTFNPQITKSETDHYINLLINTSTEKEQLYGYVYNKQTGERMELQDMLSEKDNQNFSTLVANAIKNDPTFDGADTSGSMFTDNVSHIRGFAVEPDKLLIYYAPMSILPQTFGTPVVHIPYSALSQPIEP